MVTYAETLQILDYQIDYNIKLITFMLILVYVIVLKIYTSKIDIEYAYQAVIKAFGNLMFYPTIIFTPLYTLLLFREYSAITLWTTLFVFYGVIFVIIFFIWLVYGVELTLRIFGIKADLKSWRMNKLYPEDMKSNLGDFSGGKAR